MLRFLLFLTVCCFTAFTGHAQYGFGSSHFHSGFRFGGSMFNHHHRRNSFMQDYNAAKEAGRNLNGFLRDEIGVGMIMAPATFTHHVRVVDPNTDEPQFDTGYSLTVQPKSAFIISECTGYPLATMGQDAALILTYGVTARFIDWKQEDRVINGNPLSYGISNFDIGWPLSIDFKSGGEAMLDRGKRTCFTAGAGVEPIWMTGTWGTSVSTSSFRFYPFAKMEFGIVTGFAAFKLRATGTIGKFDYFTAESMRENYSTWKSDLSIKGKSQFALTLLVMPMASKWEDAAWYR